MAFRFLAISSIFPAKLARLLKVVKQIFFSSIGLIRRKLSQDRYKKNKEERYSRVPRLLDTRYSAKGTKGKWRYASRKVRLKCATYRR